MKKGIHPDYHPVVFRDIGANYSFLTRSTATSDQTVKWEDGNEYPLIISISAASPIHSIQDSSVSVRLAAVSKSSTSVTESSNKQKNRAMALFFYWCEDYSELSELSFHSCGCMG